MQFAGAVRHAHPPEKRRLVVPSHKSVTFSWIVCRTNLLLLFVRTRPGSRLDRRDQEPPSARSGIYWDLSPDASHTLAQHDHGARCSRARLVIWLVVDRVVAPGDAESSHATPCEGHGHRSRFGEKHRRLMDVVTVDRDRARVQKGDFGVAPDATRRTTIGDVKRHGTRSEGADPATGENRELITSAGWKRRRGRGGRTNERGKAQEEYSDSHEESGTSHRGILRMREVFVKRTRSTTLNLWRLTDKLSALRLIAPRMNSPVGD